MNTNSLNKSITNKSIVKLIKVLLNHSNYLTFDLHLTSMLAFNLNLKQLNICWTITNINITYASILSLRLYRFIKISFKYL